MDRPRDPRPRRRQRGAHRPRREPSLWAQPLAYDERGFPIVPRMPSFAERVRRLLVAR